MIAHAVLAAALPLAAAAPAAPAAPGMGPPPTAGHVMVYSKPLQGVLMLHGEAAGPSRIWLWQGSGWRDLGPLGVTARSLAACTWDGKRKQLLVQGGALSIEKPGGDVDWKVDGRTLAWNGKDWRVVREGGPSPRDHHAMVFDSVRGKVVLFGGGDADPSGRADFFGDTWEWDGQTWTRVASTGPPARVHFAMAFDPERERTVLVGGYGPDGPDDRTWEWDGKTWENRGVSDVARRSSPRAVFDGSRNKVVLFGGQTDASWPTDTCEWDGARWTVVTQEGPPGRSVHALAYDEARRVVVLFGGAGPDPLADTWELTGSVWKRVGAPVPTPTPRPTP